MKAKDLMIEDWVAVHRPGDRHEQVRVKSVIGNGTIEAKTSDGLVAIGELAVEPIPLTAEILEKNGFDMDDYTVHFKEDEHYMLELVFEDDELSWTINCNEYTIMNFEYVHELQHALRLCGIEKEIIL